MTPAVSASQFPPCWPAFRRSAAELQRCGAAPTLPASVVLLCNGLLARPRASHLAGLRLAGEHRHREGGVQRQQPHHLLSCVPARAQHSDARFLSTLGAVDDVLRLQGEWWSRGCRKLMAVAQCQPRLRHCRRRERPVLLACIHGPRAMQSATPGKKRDQDALLEACESRMLRCHFTSSGRPRVCACVSCRETARMTVSMRHAVRCGTLNAHTMHNCLVCVRQWPTTQRSRRDPARVGKLPT